MIHVILDPPNSANVFMRCDVCGVRERVVDGSAEKAFRDRHAHCSAIPEWKRLVERCRASDDPRSELAKVLSDPNWFHRGLDRAKQEVAEWPEWKRKAMMVEERKDET
jgi:hypothetical protein